MTEREKMIEVIAPYVSAYGEDEAIADALIAANIGDVTEWKEKVECAKRILQIPSLPDGKTNLAYFEYNGERIQDIARQRDEYKHRAEVVEKAFLILWNECKEKLGWNIDCTMWYAKQAEKELVEGKKND